MNKAFLSSGVKVGILVFIGIVLLFYMSVRVGKFGFFREAGYDIYAVLENANGIDLKTPVQLAGIEIGKVSGVALDGYKARVALTIKKGVKIPADSRLTIRTQGALGEKYIEIIPGSEQKHLAQGEAVKNVVTTPEFDEIFTQVTSAAKGFGEIMEQFKGVLGEGEKENIRKSISNFQTASGEFKDLLKENRKSVDRIVTNTAAFSDKLGVMSDKADEAVSGLKNIVKDVGDGKGTLGLLVKDDSLYKDAKATVASLKNFAVDVEQGKGTLGKLVNDDALYSDARETVKNVREITDGIKRGEGTLGKLAKDDKLYVEAEKSMKKFQKASEAIQEQTPISILGTIFGTFF